MKGPGKSAAVVALGLLTLLLAAAPARGAAERPIIVGSKHFNEGYILSEIMAQLLEDRGFPVERKFGLGGTLVCFDALRHGGIDVYPEYSGTLSQAILKSIRPVPYAQLRRRLKSRYHLDLLDSFGFSDTYALAVGQSLAEKLGLAKISDLARHPGLRYGFSLEFLNRWDGWPGLAWAYGLSSVHPVGIEHGLAYRAIAENKIDVTDVYSTDGNIGTFHLVLLKDDRHFFPEYLAAPLVRPQVGKRAEAVLGELAGTLSAAEMRKLNAMSVLGGKSFPEIAHEFLQEKHLLHGRGTFEEPGFWATLLRRTVRHLELTLVALLAAMAVAIPAGVLVYRVEALSRPVLYAAGLLQTIPSIALLAFMIPLLGIGPVPAIVALFLYALLPILRNTAAALFSIDPVLKKVARGMGLTARQRLRHVEFPLGAPTILAGIRTAAVINIGTATLAAFIGAGGLGEPIVTGLALNDTSLILQGAIPAALLAVLTEFAFEAIERLLIPAHLRRARAE